MKVPAMAELHMEISGSGRPLVLLHGWGMHGGMFQTLTEQLAVRHRVLAVDLPGHGLSEKFAHADDLPRLAEFCMRHVLQVVKGPLILVGWSMGGLLAQYIALQFPEAVTKLILFCSTPCFCQREDWHCAVEDKVLAAFAAGLQHDYRGTLSRFLALQFFAAPNQKEDLRRARALLFARPAAQPAALQQGLQLLQNSDLRVRLAEIRCPALVINAEHDTLVPPAAGRYLAEQVPDGRCVIIKGAGHAPFLSHNETVTHFLDRFIHEH